MDAPVLMDDGLSVSVEDGVQCKAFIDSKGAWQQLTEVCTHMYTHVHNYKHGNFYQV